MKIRGFRIELGEIEAVLDTHPEVREAVVLAREDSPGDRRLVAYLMVRGDKAPPASKLRPFLEGRFPGNMVPPAFLKMGEFTLPAPGNADMRALPGPGGRPRRARPAIAGWGPM